MNNREYLDGIRANQFKKGRYDMKKACLLLAVLIVILFVSTIEAGQLASSGFYYPLKDDSPNFAPCGRWLERPSPNGCYNVGSPVYHIGSDMLASVGTSVYAISDGIVRWESSNGWGTGNIALIIEHRTSDGRIFRALYGHVKASNAKDDGDTVRAGEKVGEIGSYYNGNHLHFGVLSSGLNYPIDKNYLGRWHNNKYGIASNEFYDNGFIDPIWFITHNAPDNWISRQEISQSSLTYPIPPTNPWFNQLCMESYPPDSRCDGSDIVNFTECVFEGNSLCAPPVSDYSAIQGGGQGSEYGSGGGGSLPDFIVNKIWLEDVNGNKKTTFRPGQTIKIKAQLKNVGADSPSEIATKFYRSNGYQRDSNPTYLGVEHTDASSLEAGETHTETKTATAPITPGIYNMTAKADADSNVSEEHESNNWSAEAVFKVDNSPWLPSIFNIISK